MKFSTQFGVTNDPKKGVVFYAVFNLKEGNETKFHNAIQALYSHLPAEYNPSIAPNKEEVEMKVEGVTAFSKVFLSHIAPENHTHTIKRIAGELIMAGQNHLVKPLYDAHNITPEQVKSLKSPALICL